MIGDAVRCSDRDIRAVFDEDVPLDRTRLLLALLRGRDVRALLHAGADHDADLTGR